MARGIREAASSEAVLFFDEADAVFFDRDGAVRSGRRGRSTSCSRRSSASPGSASWPRTASRSWTAPWPGAWRSAASLRTVQPGEGRGRKAHHKAPTGSQSGEIVGREAEDLSWHSATGEMDIWQQG